MTETRAGSQCKFVQDSNTQIMKALNDAYEALPREKYHACNRLGTLPNPIKVNITSHERGASIYRYIVLKCVEMGANYLLLRGNRVQTNIPGIDGIGAPDPVDLSAADRARMAGIILAIGGQVRDGEWFYLGGAPDTLYLRDRSEVTFVDENLAGRRVYISKVHHVSSGRTVVVQKNMAQLLSDEFAASAQWEALVREGKAI